jgi:hypothetical protein
MPRRRLIVRALLVTIVVTVAGILPLHVSGATAARTTPVKPSKTDICKSLGKLGGNLDYESFKAYWDCLEIETLKNGVPLTENLACKIDPKKSWGYWTSDRRVTVHVLEYDTKTGQVSIAFWLKVGKKARVRLWVPCRY